MKVDRYTPISDLPQLLTVAETAAWFGTSEWLVYERIRRGEIPSVRLGRLLRVSRDDLIEKAAGK